MKKRILALAIVSAMVLSMVACGSSTNTGTDTSTSTSGTTTPENSTSTTVSGVRTLKDYSEISPKKWSPHEWESNDEQYILKHTVTALYNFYPNDTMDNYVVVPEAAAAMPVDVTAEYAGKYNVPADAKSGYAFKIALNKDMKWEDGTPINADTYLYSYKQLLNPKIKNFRASSAYQGNFVIANAEKYYKQGEQFLDANDGKAKDEEMLVSFKKPVIFFGAPAENYYKNAEHKDKFIVNGVDLFAKYSKEDYYPLTPELKTELLALSKNFGDGSENSYKEFCLYKVKNDEVDFEKEVGLIKNSDYEITFVLDKPITDFYLKYSLASGILVNEKLYDGNMADKGDIKKTTYGTKADNYISYGPFKLASFQADKLIVLEKNENWFGWNNPEIAKHYNYDRIECQIIPEQKTSLLEFKKGNLDSVALTTTDMETYATSDYLQLTPQSFTSKLTFNSDKTALKTREKAGVSKSLLAYKDFRKAISRSINRAEFVATCTAAADPGFGLLNTLYINDPEKGTRYRDSQPATDALLSVYEADSMDTMTGYNIDEARELIKKVYEEAKANGDIKDSDKVEFELAVYMLDETSQKMVNFINDSLANATKGTPLEGRVSVKGVVDQDYYNSAKAGKFDIIISTWGGASMDPFGLSELYCVDEKINEYGFRPKVEKTTITVEGKEMTKTFYEWYDALCNGEYAAATPEVRTQILAGIERGILETYVTAPIYYRTSGSLLSHRATMETEEFLPVVGFGNAILDKSDAEWAEYCKSNNFELKY